MLLIVGTLSGGNMRNPACLVHSMSIAGVL